jgi:hypothetical protein
MQHRHTNHSGWSQQLSVLDLDFESHHTPALPGLRRLEHVLIQSINRSVEVCMPQQNAQVEVSGCNVQQIDFQLPSCRPIS